MKFIHKITSVVLITLLTLLMPSAIFAAPLEDLSNELTTLKKDTVANQTIQFTTPNGVSADAHTITVTFETGFDLTSIDIADIDFATSTGACDTSPSFSDVTLASSDGAGEWGAAISGQVITFDAPTDVTADTGIASSTCVQIQIGTHAAAGDAQIVNPDTADVYTVAYKGTFGDTGTTTVTILDDDQVQITAEVPQSITFSISETAASFGALNASAARYATSTGDQTTESAAHNLKAGTNATAGYSITVKGATLTSGSNTITAIGGVAAASNPTTEQFGMRLTNSGGTGAPVAPYATANYAYAADANTTDQVAAASGSTALTTYNVYYLANIASDTEAGTYSTALTYVATANF